MRSELSSLTSLLPHYHPSHIKKPSRSTSMNAITNSSPQQALQTPRPIGCKEPPWHILPPPHAPSLTTNSALFDVNLRSSSTDIPFSLRFLQLKKKRLALRRPDATADLGPVGTAVWSLACTLEELQKSLVPADNSRDALESVVWLFHRVFSNSPNLVAGLLVLTSQFLVVSMETTVPAAAPEVMMAETLQGRLRPCPAPEIRVFRNWADVGILDETERRKKKKLDGEDEGSDYRRKRIAYEHMIVAEKANSLILSNYAQLLYQYEKDLDRANDYFRWAVSAEPVDAEVRSKYALFLWHGRVDFEGAEEMFLEALEADPANVYHQSNYAYFLWKTGGRDTCYPLDGSNRNGIGRTDISEL